MRTSVTLFNREIKIYDYALPCYSSWEYYHPVKETLVAKSDYNFIKQYAEIAREYDSWTDFDDLEEDEKPSEEIISKWKEIQKFISNKYYDWIFIITDSFIPIEDNILKDKQLLSDYFKSERDNIIGPEIDLQGKYLECEGTWKDALDIFGNKVTTADYKYFRCNYGWVNDEKFIGRTFVVESEKEFEIKEYISIFHRKVKSAINFAMQYDDDADEWAEPEIDGINYDPDNLEESRCIFVTSVENNLEIKKEIKNFMEKLIREYGLEDQLENPEEPVKLVVKECPYDSNVNISNPLNFTFIIE